MDPVLSLVLRGALALLFIAAAVHKLRDPDAFRAALEAYRLLPETAAGAVARALPLLELVAAASLATARLAHLGALLAAALLGIYAAAMAVNLARGRRDLDCGCMGARAESKIGGALIARNAVLIGAALATLLPVQARTLVWLDACTVPLAIAVLAALHAAIDRLLANSSGLAALRDEVRA